VAAHQASKDIRAGHHSPAAMAAAIPPLPAPTIIKSNFFIFYLKSKVKKELI
jgi:hypothetical protein